MHRLCLILISLLFLGFGTTGQAISFDHLGMSHGLSDNWAKSLIIDPDGYLWVGTINGLNRYDGRSVKTFKHDPLNPFSIGDNFVQSLAFDQSGNLWVGTYNGGISVYDPRTELFKVYSKKEVPNGINSNKVNAIVVTSTNDVWVGTEKGLLVFDPTTDEFSRLSLDIPVYSIIEDRKQYKWVGTTEGVYVFDSEENLIAHYSILPPALYERSTVTSIYQDEIGRIWAGTWGAGLYLFDQQLSNFDYIKTSHPAILALSGDKNGQLYVGTEGGGFSIINTNSLKESVFMPTATGANGINSNSIHSILYDDFTGITWLGTYNGGLNYFSKWKKPFRNYTFGKGDLNNNKVLSIAKSESALFVGTDGGGLNIITEKGSEFIDQSNGLLGNAVMSILYDSQDQLWIGTYNGGLNRLKNNNLISFDFSNEIVDNDISALFESSDGRIWIGTMEGGISVYQQKQDDIIKFTSSDTLDGGLSDNFISKIFGTSNGQIMVQTGRGLDVYDPKSNSFYSFDDKYRASLGMPIASLEDSKGNFWVGTRERLIWFDGSSSNFIDISTHIDLPNNSIAGILEDDGGNIWVSTKKGLLLLKNAIANPKQFQWFVFTEEDGIQGNDFKELASFKDKNGILYFGGQNGLTAFAPSKMKLNTVIPEVLFVGLKIFNEPVVFGEGQVLVKPINNTQLIELDYDQNSFTIDFSSTNFLQAEKNQYAYKLEGFETDYNYAGNTGMASYTNIDPGEYTFLVKVSNNDNQWNDNARAIKIVVVPPWWTTNWFKGLVFSLFLLGVFGFIRIRLYQLKQNKKELEKEVALRLKKYNEINELLNERNKEIAVKNETLLSNNEELTAKNDALEIQSRKIKELLKDVQELNDSKLRFFTNISHELRTPLTLILGPLSQLKQEQKTIGTSELGIIKKNSERLLHLINQLLDFRKIETGNMHLQASENDLIVCAKAVFESFAFFANNKDIDYQFKAEMNSIQFWFDREKIEVVLTNLLSNAFKYTKAGGSVLLTISKPDKKNIQITISDDGPGIPKEQLDDIFKLYYQSTTASNLEQAGSGIGLALIREYIELHSGKIQVESEQGIGTQFTVSIPVGKEHLKEEEMYTAPLGDYTQKLDFNYALSGLNFEISDDNKLNEEKGHSKERPLLLIVDDNEEIRSFIRDICSKHFTTIEAENGKEAFEKSLETMPDMVISDVMMPIMNGYDFCSLLKSDEKTSHIPLILLTAFDGEHEQWQGFQVGADDYLTKPFHPQIMLKKIKNILNTRSKLIEKFNNSVILDINHLDFSGVDSGFLQKAALIVDENLKDPSFGADDFSDVFDMSRRNLLRKLKATTGLSINEFIRNIRLKRSVELLMNNENNIADVAYSVGFNDPKYFSKCFKEFTGKSPKNYINSLKDVNST